MKHETNLGEIVEFYARDHDAFDVWWHKLPEEERALILAMLRDVEIVAAGMVAVAERVAAERAMLN